MLSVSWVPVVATETGGQAARIGPDRADEFGLAALLLVLHHMGLVDRLDRAEPHGYGRELPVIRHQPGMRIGGKPFAIHFTAKIVEVLLGERPLKIGTRIHARCTVPLEIDQVAELFFSVRAHEIIAAEEMVVTDIV